MLSEYKSSISMCDQLPPNNIEVEEAVLGGILLDPTAINKMANILIPEAFYVEAHQKIYRACLSLFKKGQLPDLMTVTNKLRDSKQLKSIGGTLKLGQLLDRTTNTVNIDNYAKLLLFKHLRRKAIADAQDILTLGFDEQFGPEEYFAYLERMTKGLLQYKEIFQGGDKEQLAYEALVKEIRDIELTIVDPAFKAYKLQGLANRVNKSTRQLDELYYKSLVAQSNEELLDLDALRKQYGSDVQEWFLHGFGPKGSVVLLHALGGVGKTRLIYDFIYHLAVGKPWNGFNVTANSRRTLIVQTDETPGDMLNALETRGFENHLPVRIKTKWTIDHIASLRKEIEEWKPEIILIDSLTSISRNSFFSENDTEYARPILALRDLAHEFGCLIYLIHHSNGEGGSRGTKAIYNSVSHVFGLVRPANCSDPATLDRILCVEKSRSRAPAKYKLRFDPEDGSWVCDGKDGELDDSRKTKERILNFLKNHYNTAYEPREIHEAVGGAYDYLRKCCYQLAEDGEILRIRAVKKRAYGFMLRFDPTDPQGKDQLKISSGSVARISCESTSSKDFRRSDLFDAKKSQQSEENQRKNEHKKIISESVVSEVFTDKAIEPTKLTDLLTDPLTDPIDVSVNDQLPLPLNYNPPIRLFTAGKWVEYEGKRYQIIDSTLRDAQLRGIADPVPLYLLRLVAQRAEDR